MHNYVYPRASNPLRAAPKYVYDKARRTLVLASDIPLSTINQATLDRAAAYDKEADRLERAAAEYRAKAKAMRGQE